MAGFQRKRTPFQNKNCFFSMSDVFFFPEILNDFFQEMEVAVCSFELPPETATGPGLQRLNQAARVTDAVLEVLPGGVDPKKPPEFQN